MIKRTLLFYDGDNAISIFVQTIIRKHYIQLVYPIGKRNQK